MADQEDRVRKLAREAAAKGRRHFSTDAESFWQQAMPTIITDAIRSALAEDDNAEIGKAFTELLPDKYCWGICPTEYVGLLTEERDKARADLAEAQQKEAEFHRKLDEQTTRIEANLQKAIARIKDRMANWLRCGRRYERYGTMRA